MRFTLLGTGSALPSRERLQSGMIVRSDDQPLLIDCGSGVPHRLVQAGVELSDVDTVLLTHHHLDHVVDLPTLFKARILTGTPSITVFGPPGTSQVCEQLFTVDRLSERGSVRVDERTLEKFPLEIAGMQIDAVETTHSKRCFAYRFDDSLVVSGDTAPNDEVFNLADGVHTLIHECSHPDSVDSDGHTTPKELIAWMRGIEVDRLVITHLFPDAERNIATIRSSLERNVDAEVIIGVDGLDLTV